MSKRRVRNISLFILVASFLIGWSALMIYLGPEAVVSWIGIENGYLLMLLVSLFGGVSSIGGALYVTTILTLAAGGLNPFLLGLASGVGVSIGDTVYYYLGWRGAHVLPHDSPVTNRVRHLSEWLRRQPLRLRAMVIYGYTAFTPFPNDILTILLGITRQPYLLVIPALALGNVTHTILIASFGNVLPW